MPVGRVVNRSELSEILGVSLPTVDDWIRKGCPFVQKAERKGGAGWKIDVGAVLAWHREQERQKALGDVARIDEDEARRRKLAAEAALYEHDLALKQGAAVKIDDVITVWAQQIASSRSKLLGIAHKLAPLVAVEQDALECQALIASAVHESLAELSQFDPGQLPNPPASVGPSAASAAEDAQPVGAAAAADGQRVGGRKPKAQRGSQRRAGAVDHQPS